MQSISRKNLNSCVSIPCCAAHQPTSSLTASIPNYPTLPPGRPTLTADIPNLVDELIFWSCKEINYMSQIQLMGGGDLIVVRPLEGGKRNQS